MSNKQNIYELLDKEDDIIIDNNTERIISYINKTNNTDWTVGISQDSNKYFNNVKYDNQNIFSVTYGSKDGNDDAKVIYSSFKNLLSPLGQQKWILKDSVEIDDFIVIQYDQNKFKDGINAKNIMFYYDSTKYTNSNIQPKGYVAQNIDISNCRYITDSNNDLGIIFGNLGLIILKISSIAGDNNETINTIVAGNFNNGSTKHMVVQYIEKVKSMYYVCRVKNKKFNYSNNPSFLTDNKGLRFSKMRSTSPTVYITSIGLYNQNNELLAIAKPSKPIKKNFQSQATVQIKLQF